MTLTRRVIPLAVAALAVALATTALALSGGSDAAASADRHHAHNATMTTTGHEALSAKELALRQEMRRLWQEHVVWTRLAIISLTTNAPDTKATVARLLANQTHIGNAVKPFYGAPAGKQLTALLREHILIAADLIAVARKGDTDGVASQQARWTRNADEIAAFLASANPRFWKPGRLRAMMRDHLRLTTDEVLARLQQNWAADVRAYDRVEREILHMADMLSDGLVGQFPGRFA
jgi:hypothetical protein